MNRYWSITQAIPRSSSRVAAGFVPGIRLDSARTTLPAQRIFTSRCAPKTCPGSMMSKLMRVPTFNGSAARKKTPAALTLSVVARYLRRDCVSEMVIGNCSGKRVPVRTSVTAALGPANRADLSIMVIPSRNPVLLVYITRKPYGRQMGASGKYRVASTENQVIGSSGDWKQLPQGERGGRKTHYRNIRRVPSITRSPDDPITRFSELGTRCSMAGEKFRE